MVIVILKTILDMLCMCITGTFRTVLKMINYVNKLDTHVQLKKLGCAITFLRTDDEERLDNINTFPGRTLAHNIGH